VITNTHFATNLSRVAEAIMTAAGLEPAYRDLSYVETELGTNQTTLP
jgi:hypothetical protein